MAHPAQPDEVLSALADLVEVVGDRSHAEHITDRAEVIRERRQAGEGYSDVVHAESRPLIVEMLSDYINDLVRASARFRRAEAAALHAEGLTMEQIAELFGVSRQRVSALLREARQSTT